MRAGDKDEFEFSIPRGRADKVPRSMMDVTRLLSALQDGDPQAADQLITLVYEDLRALARQRVAFEPAGGTLQPTALVHEAWLRLGADAQPTWQNRAHFFGAAAEAMRRFLIDRARRRMAAKRGSGVQPVELQVAEDLANPDQDPQILALDEALEKFATVDARKAELVKLRYFVGMTFEEAAETLGIAVPTAKLWWAYARAWLAVETQKAAGP